MKKLVSIFIFILVLFAFYRVAIVQKAHTLPQANQYNQPQVLAQIKEPLQAEKVYSPPQRLIIEKLGIDTTVEHVGADSEGRMDVPVNNANVAWWEPGVAPGQMGSAVIAGHFDNPDGSPSVFYQLDNLEAGDTVKIVDEAGNVETFRVLGSQYFSDATFPIDKVFSQNDKKRLNLITCAGVFDKESKNYTERLVVFTENVI